MTPTYTVEFGSYYLYSEVGTILLMCDQVGFAYKDEVLYKHGDYAQVRSFAQKHGLDFIRFPRGFPVEEINRCLTHTGYLPKLLEDIQAGKYDNIGDLLDTVG